MNGSNYPTYQDMFSSVFLDTVIITNEVQILCYSLAYGEQLIPSEGPNSKTNDSTLLCCTHNANLCQRINVMQRAADCRIFISAAQC